MWTGAGACAPRAPPTIGGPLGAGLGRRRSVHRRTTGEVGAFWARRESGVDPRGGVFYDPVMGVADARSFERRLGEVLGRFSEVAAAWLFGSRARGTAREGSDVDVAVLLNAGVDPSDPSLLGAIALAAEEAAGAPVDLVALDLASQGPVFCHKVLAEGVRVVDHDRARRVDFESEVSSRYLDYRPTWDIAARRSVGGLRRWIGEQR